MRKWKQLGWLGVAALAGAVATRDTPAQTPAVSPAPSACPLAALDPGVPVRRLAVEDVRAIGDAYSDSNLTRIARIASLFQAGTFGDPKTGSARAAAHQLARLLTLNAYSYMIHYATDRDTVWEADESSMAPAFETFSDPGVVPIARLRRARMGLGWMYAHYDLSEKMRTETMLGGRKLKVRIDDVTIAGRRQRVLAMDLPTGLHDVVEVWIAEEVTMRVEHAVYPGPPAPYELYVLDDMQGLWVHKYGVHRPQAFVFWVTPRDLDRTTLPEIPLIGVRIYAPHLRLRLPGFLPDIGFEDLRAVDLPQPILPIAYLRERRQPVWLEPAQLRGFKRWEGIGVLPPDVRRRFPDR
jgi:hypothetical protein